MGPHSGRAADGAGGAGSVLLFRCRAACPWTAAARGGPAAAAEKTQGGLSGRPLAVCPRICIGGMRRRPAHITGGAGPHLAWLDGGREGSSVHRRGQADSESKISSESRLSLGLQDAIRIQTHCKPKILPGPGLRLRRTSEYGAACSTSGAAARSAGPSPDSRGGGRSVSVPLISPARRRPAWPYTTDHRRRGFGCTVRIGRGARLARCREQRFDDRVSPLCCKTGASSGAASSG